MPTIYIAMGANLFLRDMYLWHAAKMLSEHCVPVRSSSIYETEPVGVIEQDHFLNCVVEMRTTLEPRPLLDVMLGIERKLGRKRDLRNGPRMIDLDLLLYDDLVLRNDALTLPHPRMHERDFVMIPLREIAPDVVHPILQRTIDQIGGQYVHSQRCIIYQHDRRGAV